MPDTKNLSSNLQGFLSEFKAKYPNVQVTSGYRPRAFTKQGALSRHAKGEAIDIAPDQEAYNYLWNTEEGLGLLNKYGLGVLDETSKEMLEKTGGTGAHYHVGSDSTLVPKARERYNEFLKQKAEKEGNINPKLIDFDFSIKSNTFVENSEEEEKEPVEVKEEVVTEAQPTFDQEQFNTLVNYNPVAQQQEQLPQAQYQQQDINSLFAQVSAFVDTPTAQEGGIPISPNGLYEYPNQPVLVNTKQGNITMEGINYEVLGIDEYGNKKLMQPNKNYQFKGKNILEIPTQFFNGKK